MSKIDNFYSKKILNHFKNPHNYGRLKNADGIGKAGNIICGDEMYFYIKVGDNQKKEKVIKDIKFEAFGCAAAISTSSVITDLVKGKTLEEAMKINSNQVVKELGGLPSLKVHCSLLGIDALSEAIYDYLSKNKMAIPQELGKRHKRITETNEKIKARRKKLEKN